MDTKHEEIIKNCTKSSDQELRQKLTPLQYHVTQQAGTELPHRNEYWNNEAEGLYVDIVSGEPLFSSREKFASSCGWAISTSFSFLNGFVESETRTWHSKQEGTNTSK